jgi:hypothetical protein
MTKFIAHQDAIRTVMSALNQSKNYNNLSEAISGLLKLVPNTKSHQTSDDVQFSHKQAMWVEQIAINFPLMYLSCVYVYLYAQKHKISTILFASRDCCHMVKIFRRMFPRIPVTYFSCSRIMFETGVGNPHYRQYVTKLMGRTGVDKTLFVDIHGTGRRVMEYFSQEFGQTPHCILLSSGNSHYDDFPELCIKAEIMGRFTNLTFDLNGSPIESLNYDLIGTLKNYGKDGEIREPLEYKISAVQPYHDAMAQIQELLYPLTSEQIEGYSMRSLSKMIKRISEVIQSSKPTVLTQFEHVRKHKR